MWVIKLLYRITHILFWINFTLFQCFGLKLFLRLITFYRNQCDCIIPLIWMNVWVIDFYQRIYVCIYLFICKYITSLSIVL